MPPLSRAQAFAEKVVLLLLIPAAVVFNWKVSIATPSRITFMWIMNMGFLLVFAVLAGHVITGLLRGVLIDSSNKISLSRFQMLLWTVLILSGFLMAVVINLRRGQAEPLSVALPQDLWGLLGISTASLVGSPLIKNNKKSEPRNPNAEAKMNDLMEAKGEAPSKVHLEGVHVVNNKPEYASFTDMFKGEEGGNFNYLDLGKIQMFFFTMITWFVYATALLAMFKASIEPNKPKISAFPDLDTGIIALLGISHAAYLTTKAVPHTPEQPGQNPQT